MTNQVRNESPRPHLRHTGSGWCAKCQTTCLLLDDYEKYATDMAYEAEDYIGYDDSDDT